MGSQFVPTPWSFTWPSCCRHAHITRHKFPQLPLADLAHGWRLDQLRPMLGVLHGLTAVHHWDHLCSLDSTSTQGCVCAPADNSSGLWCYVHSHEGSRGARTASHNH